MKKQFSTFSVIPTEVMISKELSNTAKILYGIISSLTNEKGYCWASNKYLGETLDISERQIINIINKLEENNLIRVNVEDNWKRKITLKNTIGGMKKSSGGGEEKFIGVRNKVHPNNIIEQDKDNIYIADKSANDKKPINKGESDILKVSDLYDKMGLPKQTRKVEKWQDSASIVIKEMNVPENKISSVFKCFKENEREAMFAFRDCKELGKMNVLYFLKVYNELVKKLR